MTHRSHGFRRLLRGRIRIAASVVAVVAVAVLALAGCGGEKPPRVLVIGLDGATFDKMDPLLEEGALPNLAALLERGSGAVLETTLPAVSPPAWASAITGVNPGKHNIFDFYRMAVSSTSGILNTSRDRRAHAVWDFLNEDGFRTGVMNIPMTFPPDTVDGFFISGFPYGEAGTTTTGYTHPPALEQELQEAGPYPLDPFGEGIVAGSEAPFLKRLERTFDRQSEEAERLMREKDWDLFWVVFTGVDKSQHFFWKFQDPEHPDYDPGLAEMYGGVIRDFYVGADRVIGRMLEIAGPETNVIVMSDHGFGPVYREIRMWNWLQKERFFYPGQEAGGAPYVEAYPPGPFANALRVAIQGRDPGGRLHPGAEASEVKRRLMEELSEVTDPVTGEKVAARIYSRDELYHGPYVDNAPDVVFLERYGQFAGRGAIETGDASQPMFGPPSYSFSGFHRPEGVLIAAGPDFARGEGRPTLSILDIAPTIYWLFRTRAPSDLDGRVPAELVGDEALAARPPAVGEDRRAVMDPSDAELSEGSREVLETLGYVQ
jgi:predicted AlkP superfamily phosphohydrolase/phosphomutase